MLRQADAQVLQQEQIEKYFTQRTVYWHNAYATGDLKQSLIRERLVAVLEWIVSLRLAPGSRVLEAGCGAGFLSLALADYGFTVTATDAVEGMVEQTRQLVEERGGVPSLSVALADVQALDFPDATFDLSMAIGVLPWLDQPDQAVRELARVTRPGGHVILSTANRFSWISQIDPFINPELKPLKRRAKALLARAGHPRPLPTMEYHSNRLILRMLECAGLVPTRVRTLGFGPLTLARHNILPNPVGLTLNRGLQNLAEWGVPGIRGAGVTAIFEARKPALER